MKTCIKEQKDLLFRQLMMITAITSARTPACVTHVAGFASVHSRYSCSINNDVIQNGGLLLRSLDYVISYALSVVSHAYGFTVHGSTYQVIPLVLVSGTVCHVVKYCLKGLNSYCGCSRQQNQPRESHRQVYVRWLQTVIIIMQLVVCILWFLGLKVFCFWSCVVFVFWLMVRQSKKHVLPVGCKFLD